MSTMIQRTDTAPATGDEVVTHLVPGARAARKGGRLFSLTGVCFVFGGVLAMQLRAIEQVQDKKQNEQKAQAQAAVQAVQNRAEAQKAEKETATLQAQLAALKRKLNSDSLGTKQKEQLLTQFNARIKELQLVAGLTAVSGPGVRVVMKDNPQAAGQGGNSSFLPGVVHDFDLLQVVNELRAAQAEAIAINGTRITGYAPIRCVGPTIQINWEGVTPPFVIEAIGDPARLDAALRMPGGILQNLQNPEVGPALDIRLTRSSKLSLPASAGGAPRLKEAKAR